MPPRAWFRDGKQVLIGHFLQSARRHWRSSQLVRSLTRRSSSAATGTPARCRRHAAGPPLRRQRRRRVVAVWPRRTRPCTATSTLVLLPDGDTRMRCARRSRRFSPPPAGTSAWRSAAWRARVSERVADVASRSRRSIGAVLKSAPARWHQAPVRLDQARHRRRPADLGLPSAKTLETVQRHRRATVTSPYRPRSPTVGETRPGGLKTCRRRCGGRGRRPGSQLERAGRQRPDHARPRPSWPHRARGHAARSDPRPWLHTP